MEQTVQVQNIDLTPVQKFLAEEIQRWEQEHPNQGGWAVLKGQVPLRDVLKFMIESTDEFVVMVGGMVGSTGDVKTIVLDIVGKLYDTIMIGVLPLWAKPFAGAIRFVVINCLLSGVIDYLVRQYSTGVRVALTVQHGEVVRMMQWKAI